MTAGLFQRHGVFFGECRPGNENNHKGFFENTKIKQAMIRRWGKLTLARSETNFEKNPACDPQDGFRDEVEGILKAEGYSEGPWGYKCSALYKNAFHEFDPIFIGVRREKVFEANMDRQRMFGTNNPKRVQRMIDLHHAVIDTCDVIVRPDDLVKGDYRSLEDAFLLCDLTLDPKKVQDFVEPSLWHH